MWIEEAEAETTSMPKRTRRAGRIRDDDEPASALRQVGRTTAAAGHALKTKDRSEVKKLNRVKAAAPSAAAAAAAESDEPPTCERMAQLSLIHISEPTRPY